ncbi:hypothetical protein SGM_4960 [Streptomyces griseoaurantiacus M045]|uniref:Uncharacterized protein n=1 Tax=Streptomyces griseoaurantiacus M045 TaxID=996637 RepID=F3NP96_9ACTN|nr:hypothetical protein SGM_4960 [Streptomyces griseoaurantiacus M045]
MWEPPRVVDVTLTVSTCVHLWTFADRGPVAVTFGTRAGHRAPGTRPCGRQGPDGGALSGRPAPGRVGRPAPFPRGRAPRRGGGSGTAGRFERVEP